MSDQLTQEHIDRDSENNQAHEEHSSQQFPGLNRSRFSSRQTVIIVAIVALVGLVAIMAVLYLRSGRADPKGEKAAAETKKSGENESPSEVKLSPEAILAAGLQIEGVTQRPAVSLLKVTGTVETNQQQTQQVTPLVGGRVERVNVALGDRVKTGMVLAIIASSEVAEMRGKLREAQTRLQLAQRNLQRVQQAENRVGVLSAKAKLDEAEATLRRTRRLIELGVGAGKDLVAAEAAYQTAKAEYDFQSNISLNREMQEAQAETDTAHAEVSHLEQSLRALGATAGSEGNSTALIDVRAPVSGAVTERLVNPGSGVEAGKPLFTIANIAVVWVIANVPESQIASLRVGAPAEVRLPALGGDAIAGRINYIDPHLNEEARTARVRVEVANPGERLKAGMFVEVGFQAGGAGNSQGQELVVPSVAVQRIGERTIVFVPKDGESGAFEVRDVELGGEVDEHFRILSGLKLGDRVVTKGSFTLKTQLMKGELGEGE